MRSNGALFQIVRTPFSMRVACSCLQRTRLRKSIMKLPKARPNERSIAESSHSVAPSTPPGYNKERRNYIKTLLAVCVVCLVMGQTVLATASSCCLWILKQMTAASTKNWRWGFLSVVTFAISLSSMLLSESAQLVDADRAYILYMMLTIPSLWLRWGWSAILGLFLISAYLTPKT